MRNVLEGVRVVAFTHFAAGPGVAQFLGALGADVIKIEPPGGEASRTLIRDAEGRFGGQSPSFVTLNRNQRGIAVDLKIESGRTVIKRLVGCADVLIENYKPGALDRLGFDYKTVRVDNPGIIYCPISGYNPTGPKSKELGQDMLLQGVSGMASLSGREGLGPTPVGIFAVDAYTAMINVIAVLSALRHRDFSGEGQFVHADMLSSALHMMMEEASYVLNVDPTIERSRPYAGHPQAKVPYGAYSASDGDFVLSIADSDQLKVFAEALGVSEEIGPLISELGQRRYRDKIGEVLTRVFATKSISEIGDAAAGAGIWMGPVRSLAEALDDPAVLANGLIGEHQTEAFGRYRYVREPITLTASPLKQSRSAPALGEHTREVLTELGYDATQIQQLIADGAVVVKD